MTFANYKMESHDISGCFYSHIPNNYETTLEDILHARDVTPMNEKTGLSPNGIFKYFDREVAKSSNHKYGRYMKNQRTNEKRIRRPLNCFMVFSHLERKRVADEHPELHNADLSKILGKRWKNLTSSERQPYIAEAERIRQLHTEMYPDYKYQPRRKTQSKKGLKKTEDTEEKRNEKSEDTESRISESSMEDEDRFKDDDVKYSCQAITQKKQHLPEKKKHPSICQQENTTKVEYCGGSFPDYTSSYIQEKQNDDFLFDGQQYSYQHFDSLYDQSSPDLSPISPQNIQTAQSILNTNNNQLYNCNNDSRTVDSDIGNEMTYRDKQMLFPTYCKETVKTHMIMEMNFDSSYLADNNNCYHNNNTFSNQYEHNYLNSQPLDNGFNENDYPKVMSLVKNGLTASFTNIVESLQNIH